MKFKLPYVALASVLDSTDLRYRLEAHSSHPTIWNPSEAWEDAQEAHRETQTHILEFN